MGQQEVMEFLIRQRLSGEIKFFSANEIIKGLGKDSARATCVRATLNKLVDFGYIQVAHNVKWHKLYKVKSKYANVTMLNTLSETVEINGVTY